ncbi:MAG: Ca-activated chloride channel [Blastocatellia bacterium]|jgi:VWFA-related protein|nr:Ca-activated chloride channel [Blastocatellia bacterium]
MRSKRNGQRLKFYRLLPVCLLFSSFALWPAAFGLASVDDGVRADLPANNALRIENWRGGVKVEVWNEKHVSVVATVDGATPKNSPVVINRAARLLSLSVARQRPGATPQRVELTVRIPQRARVEVVTSSGEINLSGVPAAFNARTIKGDIRAEISPTSDAKLTAQTVSGMIDSAFDATTSASPGSPNFEATLGRGSSLLRLSSERGRITLASTESQTAASAAAPSPDNTAVASSPGNAQTSPPDSQPSNAEPRRPPTLVGGDSKGGGAGTPATPFSTPEEIDDEDIVRVDTELVTVNMSVIDRNTYRGLTGLTQSDFKVYEDGAQQQIAHFEAASAPFNLVLLIDLSGSTQDIVKLIREAALHFVNAARPADRISVITFASAPVIVSPLTSDREALRRRINSIEQPHGSTKVYDALNAAIDEVLKGAKDSRRNAIVLMSDGLDSTMPNVAGEGSTVGYNELLARVREFDGVLYTLWLQTETELSSLSALDIQPETYDLAHDRMQELAEAGGGIFYEVLSLEDLAGAYEHVVADLGTVYSIGYRPTNKLRNGKWRSIRIAVSRPNAAARGKRGYYAN